MGSQNGCGSKPMGSHFGVGAPPVLVYFSGDFDVHGVYGILTMAKLQLGVVALTSTI